MVESNIFVLAVFVCGIVAEYHNRRIQYMKCNGSQDDYQYNVKYGLAYVVLVAIFIFYSGFRYYVGEDFGAYYKSTFTLEYIISRIQNLDEPIIWFITYLTRSVIDDGVAVIFVESAITISLFFYGIRQYDEGDITLSALLYIFVGPLLFSFNGVRQALAVAFIFAFSKKAERFWILKYAVVIFVAFLIHKSALFVFPILILAQRKFGWKQMMLVGIASYFLPIFFEAFYDFMNISSDNVYAVHEINSLRVVVAFAPVLLLVIPLFYDRNFFNKYSFITNMVFMNAILTLTTSNSALMNRMVQYTCVFIPVYIPKFKKYFQGRNNKLLFCLIVIVLYYVYWRFELGSDFVYTWSFRYWGLF